MLTIQEAITQRQSTRSFTNEAPPPTLLKEVCEGYGSLQPLEASAIGTGKVGTYGVITGHPSYIAVIGGDAFKAGIEGEKAVIELTRRGYATCWLGGTFNRTIVERALNIPQGERVLAVIAVGHASGKRSLLEKISRAAVRSTKRKPLPQLIIAGVPANYLTEALEALRTAPSACNRQPWRLAFNPSGSIDVYGTPSDSFMRLDVGIAVSHFLLMRPDFHLETNKNNHPSLEPIITLHPSYV